MRLMVISNPAEAGRCYAQARREGYTTFICHHADAGHTLSSEEFIYVGSDEEMEEKVRLLEADPTILQRL